jgi:hypothetical protein
MFAVGDCAHAQLVALTRPHPIAFHFSIEVMATMSVRTAVVGEEFEALAKNQYRNIVSTFSTCLATACIIGQRSRTQEKFSACSSFYFHIRDGAYEIYENWHHTKVSCYMYMVSLA